MPRARSFCWRRTFASAASISARLRLAAATCAASLARATAASRSARSDLAFSPALNCFALSAISSFARASRAFSRSDSRRTTRSAHCSARLSKERRFYKAVPRRQRVFWRGLRPFPTVQLPRRRQVMRQLRHLATARLRGSESITVVRCPESRRRLLLDPPEQRKCPQVQLKRETPARVSRGEHITKSSTGARLTTLNTAPLALNTWFTMKGRLLIHRCGRLPIQTDQSTNTTENWPFPGIFCFSS